MTKLKIKHILTLNFILFFINVFSQNSIEIQQNFKREIDIIYDFHPPKLSKEEHSVVIKELDTLFSKVDKDTNLYLPLIREELKTKGHLPYFYYDCSHLLMLHSKSKSDLQICADAFLKCDITEVGPKEFVQLTTFLAKKGINTTQVGMKILEDSNFMFFIPEHSFKYSQSYCLLYCLHNLKPELYTDSLINYFKSTKNEDNQRAIITVLWFSYSCKGDDFLKSLNSETVLNEGVLEYAKEILTYNNMDQYHEYAYEKSTPRKLKKYKKEALSHFSDEAIWDLDFITKAQRRKGKCN